MINNHPKRIFDFVLTQAKNSKKKPFFYYKENEKWNYIHLQEFVEKGNQLSMGLLVKKIKKGDLVVLVSNNRYEWLLIDFAVTQIGAVLVPLYTSLPSDEYAYILNETKPKMVLVANENLHKSILNAYEINQCSYPTYTIDPINNVPNYSTLFETKIFESVIERKRNAVNEKDLMTIIFTSGTEGKPKGVMLSHENVTNNILNISEVIKIDHRDVALSFLPLNHIYEKAVSYFFIYTGCRMYFAESLVKVIDNIKEVHPTIFTSIPLMIKKIYDKIIDKGNELKGFKKKIFDAAIQFSQNWDNEKTYSIKKKLQYFIYNKLVYKKWRQALGGRINIISTGSAAINPVLIRVFNCAKINLLEGYGLTETSPVISVNSIGKGGIKIGTVGKTIPGVKIKIEKDGEILTKGKNIMMGYFNNQEKTNEVLSADGWFATGDIGKLIDGTYLKITDRKKEIFKTSGGKYVAPQFVEGKAKESILIENIMVVGENQDVVGAIIQPNWENLKKHCLDNNIPHSTNADNILQNQVIQLYRAEIEKANLQLASHEKIRRVELVADTWSIATNELTPTLKIKRRVISDNYKLLIDKMFH